MHHAHHIGRGAAASGWPGWETMLPWFLLVALLAAGAVVLVWWLLNRARTPGSAKTSVPAEASDNVDGQIHAMLAQAGGELDQVQISSNLGLPVAEIAATLRRLEDEGFITRTWQPSGYTYLVRSARRASEQDAAPLHPGGPASADNPDTVCT